MSIYLRKVWPDQKGSTHSKQIRSMHLSTTSISIQSTKSKCRDYKTQSRKPNATIQTSLILRGLVMPLLDIHRINNRSSQRKTNTTSNLERRIDQPTTQTLHIRRHRS